MGWELNWKLKLLHTRPPPPGIKPDNLIMSEDADLEPQEAC